MQSSSLRRTLPRLLFAIAALAIGLLVANRDSANAAPFSLTFTATSTTALCDQSGAAFGVVPLCPDVPANLAVGFPADITTKLVIPAADSNYSTVVTAVPPQSFVAAGPGHPTIVSGFMPAAVEDGGGAGSCSNGIDDPGGDLLIDGDDPECNINSGGTPWLGEIMGQVTAGETLGLLNGVCGPPDNFDPVSFRLLNATVNLGPQVNPVPALMASAEGTLRPMLEDDGGDPATLPPTPPVDPVDGLPAAVKRMPGYLKHMFDPDSTSLGADGIYGTADVGEVNGPTPIVQPLARYVGSAVVAGTAVTLNLVYFSNNDLAVAYRGPHPFADLADMGITSVAVLQNPTAPQSADAITCFPAALSMITTVFGESRLNACAGFVAGPCAFRPGILSPVIGANTLKDRYNNPAAAGTYLFTGFHQSLRDADGDGLENTIDSCDLAVNIGISPKVGAGPDGDMLDDVCDPFPLVANPNEDGDAGALNPWFNSIDNCPLPPDANPGQADNELNLSYYNPFATNPAPHGGPKADQMGDPCDPDDMKAAGDWITTLNVTAKCIGGVDADGDGYCAGPGIGGGVATFDPVDAAGAITPEDYDLISVGGVAQSGPTWLPGANSYGETVAECVNAADDDQDGYVNDGCAQAGIFPESGLECQNAVDSPDEDTSTAGAQTDDPATINDGCPGRTTGQARQVCNDGLDNDGDTLVDILDSAVGNSSCAPTSVQAAVTAPLCATTGCGLIPETVCGDAADSDGDGLVNDGCGAIGPPEMGADCYVAGNPDGDGVINDGCPAGGSADNDGDGFTDEQERWIGTDAVGRCAAGAGPVGVPSAAWPLDLFNGTPDKITLQDLTSFIATPSKFGTNPGMLTFDKRWDLVPGGVPYIGLPDFVAVIASAAASGVPPMIDPDGPFVFGPIRAFNGPACTNHPVFGN